MLWIRNRSDRHPLPFSEFGPLSISTKCKAKQNFFPENVNIPVQNIENYDTFDAEEDETMKTDTAVNKNHKFLIFYHV